MEDLLSKKCVPCEGGTVPFSPEKSEKYLSQASGWKMEADGRTISKQFSFKDFREAMAFVNKVADAAESEGHHPDMVINYNKVIMKLQTHAIGGLSENDFIMAAKINHLFS